MSVRVVRFSELTASEKQRIDVLTKDASIYVQLEYCNALTQGQFFIFVYGDFESFIYIPYRKKYGIVYAYRPVFYQQCVLVGNEKHYAALMDAVQRRIKYGDISLDRFKTNTTRTNYQLNLNAPYETLRANFSTNHKRNCNKAKYLRIEKVATPEALIRLFVHEKEAVFSPSHLTEIKNAIHALSKAEPMQTKLSHFVAFDGDTAVAATLFITHNQRLYYLLGASLKNDPNYSSKGLFALFNHLIQHHAQTPTTLDFEGSDIPGIARFFKGFGAVKTHYFTLKWNKLPFPLNKLKS